MQGSGPFQVGLPFGEPPKGVSLEKDVARCLSGLTLSSKCCFDM